MYDGQFLAEVESRLRDMLPEWGLSFTTCVRLLTISENATYLADDPESGARCVLRVHRPNYHDATEIQSELDWISALDVEGAVRVARPRGRRDGTFIGQFESEGASRHVVAFEFVEGAAPEPTGSIELWFRDLGALNARMHEHGRRWNRPTHFFRKSWDFETTLGSKPIWGPWRDGLDLDGRDIRTLSRTVELIENRLNDFGKSSDRFGLIHADLRLANLLASGEELTVIDFDDCGFGWFMYDFAAALSFHEHESFVPAVQSAWVEGYRRVMELDEKSEAMLPVFVMLRRILLMAWIASHRETPTAEFYGTGFTRTTVEMADAFIERQAG